VEHLKSASLEKALTLPANRIRLIRLGWKSLQVKNYSSLLQRFVFYGQKSFITLGPGRDHEARGHPLDVGRRPFRRGLRCPDLSKHLLLRQVVGETNRERAAEAQQVAHGSRQLVPVDVSDHSVTVEKLVTSMGEIA
jgi:hypothetical protein